MTTPLNNSRDKIILGIAAIYVLFFIGLVIHGSSKSKPESQSSITSETEVEFVTTNEGNETIHEGETIPEVASTEIPSSSPSISEEATSDQPISSSEDTAGDSVTPEEPVAQEVVSDIVDKTETPMDYSEEKEVSLQQPWIDRELQSAALAVGPMVGMEPLKEKITQQINHRRNSSSEDVPQQTEGLVQNFDQDQQMPEGVYSKETADEVSVPVPQDMSVPMPESPSPSPVLSNSKIIFESKEDQKIPATAYQKSFLTHSVRSCAMKDFGVEFKCDLNWEMADGTKAEDASIIVSNDPLVIMNWKKFAQNIRFIGQLNKFFFEKLGIYQEGFVTENVNFAGHQAVFVKGFDQKSSQMQRRDYFYLNDQKLVCVSFSFSTQEKEKEGRKIVQEIKDSFLPIE